MIIFYKNAFPLDLKSFSTSQNEPIHSLETLCPLDGKINFISRNKLTLKLFPRIRMNWLYKDMYGFQEKNEFLTESKTISASKNNHSVKRIISTRRKTSFHFPE